MNYEYGNWFMVILNIAIFLYFIKSAFKPRTKTDWKTYKMFGAFIVALFAEMYGFPLTVFLLTSFFGNIFKIDFSHENGHLLNTLLGIKGDPHFSFLHILSNVLIIGGLILLAKAWQVLYKSQRAHRLAMVGLYRFIRHPQYLAFILIILGFLIQWPTLITLLMAPILIFRYLRLAHSEEQLMLKKYPLAYSTYKRKTPAYIPSLKHLFSSFTKRLSVRKV